MKKLLALLLCLALLPAVAFSDGISVDAVEDTLHPWQSVSVAFETPKAGLAWIGLTDEEGETVSVLTESYDAWAGHNRLKWNVTHGGIPAPEGTYRLTVRQGDLEGWTLVTVGRPAPVLSGVSAGETVSPAEPLTITFSSNLSCTLELLDDTGTETLAQWEAQPGQQTVTWDGGALTDGAHTLTLLLTDGDLASETAAITVTASGFSAAAVEEDDDPEIEGLHIETIVDEQDDPAEETADEPEDEEETGETEIGDAPDQAETAPEENAVSADQSVFTPSYSSPYAAREEEAGTYWTTPMDITDEAAVWEMLMKPITVVDTGKKRSQMAQLVIREEPDENSRGVGVVTCVSQGVRVLEESGDWTKIECYSSSFHDSKVKAWNMLVQGWIETKYIQTKTPDPGMGIVVDKLTQRLYIFVDGHLYDTLLCSTGHANEKQPYNESRSGEFLLLVPAVGGYVDEGMYVEMAIRYNAGDMVHQVPYTKAADGGKYFGTFEPRLGTKASHGCIRVQRRKTPKGTSMEWVYKNKKNNTKFVIWEDWQGRQLSYAADDTPVYYNPKGGKLYHSSETCASAKNVTFTPFTYGELETGAYAKLTRCTYCNPPLRKAEIDEINALYAPGGDHDPILTAAQQKYLDGAYD